MFEFESHSTWGIYALHRTTIRAIWSFRLAWEEILETAMLMVDTISELDGRCHFSQRMATFAGRAYATRDGVVQCHVVSSCTSCQFKELQSESHETTCCLSLSAQCLQKTFALTHRSIAKPPMETLQGQQFSVFSVITDKSLNAFWESYPFNTLLMGFHIKDIVWWKMPCSCRLWWLHTIPP